MSFLTKRQSTGGNPGLTPIDDIHGGGPTTDLDPESSTGRLPEREETGERKVKRKNNTGKKGNRKSG